jgi:hypothetical protein
MKARSRWSQGWRAWRSPAATASSRLSGVPSPWRALGALAGILGLATAAIGLPTSTSSATRKPKNWFQVAHARSDTGGDVGVRVRCERPAQGLSAQMAEVQLLGLCAVPFGQQDRDGSQVAPVVLVVVLGQQQGSLVLLGGPKSGRCDKFQAAKPRRAFMT